MTRPGSLPEGESGVNTVIPLRRKAAYTPLDPPCQCMTPGHEDITRYPAGLYPGGRLCGRCIAKSRQAMSGSDEDGDAA